MSPLVAVVGAGPAGIYAADALLQQRPDVEVAVIDRLPVPFGLVRYGVAPDHPSIRSIRDTLERILDQPGVRFFGNVTIGADLTVAELRGVVDAVIYSYGAGSANRLDIDGEDLPGSMPASDLVAWYCGDPDAHPDEDPGAHRDSHPDSDGTGPRGAEPGAMAALLRGVRSVVVVGAGNVALDVARVLLKTADELAETDMATPVLAGLAGKDVREVHLLCRRGPADAAFTTKELRELNKIDDLDIVILPEGIDLAAERQRVAGVNRVATRNVDVFAGWQAARSRDASRRLWMHFRTTPVAITGTDKVTGVRVLPSRADPEQTPELLPADLVIRSIGYRGLPLAGVPFDESAGRVPQIDGRVLRDDAVAPGEYVAGWIRRGPTGVIGTNKHDAAGTVTSLLADLAKGIIGDRHDLDELTALLHAKGIEPLDMPAWHRIDAAEIARGLREGRERATLPHRRDLLAAARARLQSAPADPAVGA